MYLLFIVGAAGFILLSNEHSYIKLKRIASYDDLTGILNRGAFLQEAEIKLEKAVRGQEYFSFLLLDLDHFKEVNDTYGHDAGDIVLEDFASTIKDNLGNGDLFGRLGGEEFAVILCEVDEQSCDQKAEALRLAVMNASAPKIPQGYTVSIGVITIMPDQEITINKLYKLSDKALYQAKQEGRNRVIRYRYVY
jgi:diguanylate cyclase (GGDEF)-like protein